MNYEKENTGFSKILSFFIFCAAADEGLLKQCPASEHHKYAGVGATVFSTGVLASVSGGFALYTAFHIVWLSVSLGLFWGLLVFNLDRFLVSTMKKSRGKLKELIQITPRLLLAVLLAIVISTPLELRIFEEEINESLYYAGAQKLDRLDSLYQGRISNKQKKIDQIKNETERKLEIRDEYYRQYICECDGTCGTGQKGRGTECERKEQKYLKSDQEYSAAKKEHDQEIALITAEKEKLFEQQIKEKERLEASFSDGLLVRLDLLKTLPYGPQLAIILLLIAIEIAPILVKLLSPYGPYDHLIKTIEYEFEIDEITAINMRNQQLNNKLTLMASVEQGKIDQELKNNEGAMKLIGEAHLELVKEQLKIWIDKEKTKIQEEYLDDNLPEK
ncbi:MAG: DUF4407 domain-containing protein [Cyclobacteriaceae bacterium]